MTITFPWSAHGGKHASSDDKKNRVGEDLKVPGLQNMGNNCFLNVVLQVMITADIDHVYKYIHSALNLCSCSEDVDDDVFYTFNQRRFSSPDYFPLIVSSL